MEPLTVPVSQEGIRLGQFLKLAGAVESGSHARDLLTEGEVTVNGDVEQRRGRQLVGGDVVVVALPTGEQGYVVG